MTQPPKVTEELVRLYQSVEDIKFCPWKPGPKQRVFLLFKSRQALYGGAARGGKSVAQLMAALQFICVPGYNALILRKSMADLELQGGLIDLSRVWFNDYATWNGKTYTWSFQTSGKRSSTIGFGYLNNPGDQYRYKGSEIQFYGLEEATEIPDEEMAYYPESRLTLPKDLDDELEACSCHGWTLADIPLRFRLTSNPGGVGADWVYRDFVKPARERRTPELFLPANVYDNPYVDPDAYVESLRNLSPTERARLLDGNWEVTDEGKVFSRKRFKLIHLDHVPWDRLSLVRRWDLASLKEQKGKRPDWSAGALGGLDRDTADFYIIDVRRIREEPGEVEKFLRRAHIWDDNLTGGLVPIRAEEGKSGDGAWATKGLADGVFLGLDFYGVKPKGSKTERAIPLGAACTRGKVYVVEAEWNEEFFIEAELFPDGAHDDQVDAVTGAYYDLTNGSVGGGSYDGSGGIPADGELGHVYDSADLVGLTGS